MKVIPVSIALALLIGSALGQTLCDPKDFPMQRPVEVSQVRGTVAGANGGAIRDVRVEIRKLRLRTRAPHIARLDTGSAGLNK